MINLRDFYPWYINDEYIEVSDEVAVELRADRLYEAAHQHRVPLSTRGQPLLAGNVFCGHCGARLFLTTNAKPYPCKDDPQPHCETCAVCLLWETRKQTECDGHIGYTAHILNGIIDKLVWPIFERMKAIPKSEVVNIRCREKMEERKSLFQSVRADCAKAAAEVDMLKAEVIKVPARRKRLFTGFARLFNC